MTKLNSAYPLLKKLNSQAGVQAVIINLQLLISANAYIQFIQCIILVTMKSDGKINILQFQKGKSSTTKKHFLQAKNQEKQN